MEYVWNGYRESLEAKPAGKTMLFEGKAILPFFGRLEAEAVTEEDCRAYLERRRLAGRKDGTIWTELGRLPGSLSVSRQFADYRLAVAATGSWIDTADAEE